MDSRNAHISRSCRIKIGLTLGDPSGIGPEIALAATSAFKEKADFTVIGDKWVFDKAIVRSSRHRVIGGQAKFRVSRFIDLENVPHKGFSFGKIRGEYGKASIEYLDKALELIKNKEIDCLVTCPISKEAINLAGFNFPGHTEYLAKQTKTENFVMLLLNKRLKISLLTRHVPLERVPFEINEGIICKTLLLTYKALKELFLIKIPRIAVCGLNPHASDNGLIGKQELRIIRPALERLKGKLKNIAGPLSADVAMFKAIQNEFDCVVAMYHDQALIALKLVDKESGVNMTLGLPFIRTSPLHGTAFDIAGKGMADPSSLIEAINLAVRCAQNLKKA